MEKKKIFVLEQTCGLELAAAILDVYEKNSLEADMKINHLPEGRLPEGFDFYFIHLSDLDERSNLDIVKKLQPESYFYEMGLGGGLYKGEKRLYQEEHTIFTDRNIEKILMRGITHKSS